MTLTCVIWKINHIQQLAEKHITQSLKKGHIPVLRSHIPLFYILPSSGEGMLFHELVSRWGISKSSVSETTARYEAMGLVAKCTCGEDKRSVYVLLTKEGIALTAKLRKIESDFLSTILAGYSEAERKQFNDFLDQIIQNGSKEEDQLCCHKATLSKG